MAKAARYSVSASRAAPADRSARDQSATDVFMAVVIFSLCGLLVSLSALVLGLPQLGD